MTRKEFDQMRKLRYCSVIGQKATRFFILLLWFFLTNCFLLPGKGKQTTLIPAKVNRLYSDVLRLATIKPPRNWEHPESLNRIANYIFTELKKCGFLVKYQTFSVRGREYKNVIALIGSKKTERIVVGAHYDVCGNQPGADDNGSGVAALLELARLINELKPRLLYGVELVAYSLEEPPFFRSEFMGSAVHARSLAAVDIKVKWMLSLDMIGYFSSVPGRGKHLPPLQESPVNDRNNYSALVGKIGQEKTIKRIERLIMEGSKIKIKSIIAPLTTPGIDYSDHLNYWKNNFTALLLTNFPISSNPNYHSPADTIDTLNFTQLAEIVRGLYYVIVHF
jgi:Zn-dependent M28 family amino/carboxypeptidase